MSQLAAPPPEPLLAWTASDQAQIDLALVRLAASLTLAEGTTTTVADLCGAAALPRLQRLIDRLGQRTPSGPAKLQGDAALTAEPADLLALLTAGFANILAHELRLDWWVLAESADREPVLRYRETEVVFYPRRLLARQWEQPAAIDLALLLRNTREYLVNLQRFLFTDRSSRKSQNPTGKGKVAGHS